MLALTSRALRLSSDEEVATAPMELLLFSNGFPNSQAISMLSAGFGGLTANFTYGLGRSNRPECKPGSPCPDGIAPTPAAPEALID